MTYTYFEFKGINNRKYRIRRFNNEPYQFWEGGKWQFEMKGDIALQEMINDIYRKGGQLVKAYTNEEEVKTLKTETYHDLSGRYFKIEFLNIGRVGITSVNDDLTLTTVGMELPDFLEMAKEYGWEMI
jgi:hypothetical protein